MDFNPLGMNPVLQEDLPQRQAPDEYEPDTRKNFNPLEILLLCIVVWFGFWLALLALPPYNTATSTETQSIWDKITNPGSQTWSQFWQDLRHPVVESSEYDKVEDRYLRYLTLAKVTSNGHVSRPPVMARTYVFQEAGEITSTSSSSVSGTPEFRVLDVIGPRITNGISNVQESFSKAAKFFKHSTKPKDMAAAKEFYAYASKVDQDLEIFEASLTKVNSDPHLQRELHVEFLAHLETYAAHAHEKLASLGAKMWDLTSDELEGETAEERDAKEVLEDAQRMVDVKMFFLMDKISILSTSVELPGVTTETMTSSVVAPRLTRPIVEPIKPRTTEMSKATKKASKTRSSAIREKATEKKWWWVPLSIVSSTTKTSSLVESPMTRPNVEPMKQHPQGVSTETISLVGTKSSTLGEKLAYEEWSAQLSSMMKETTPSPPAEPSLTRPVVDPIKPQTHETSTKSSPAVESKSKIAQESQRWLSAQLSNVIMDTTSSSLAEPPGSRPIVNPMKPQPQVSKQTGPVVETMISTTRQKTVHEKVSVTAETASSSLAGPSTSIMQPIEKEPSKSKLQELSEEIAPVLEAKISTAREKITIGAKSSTTRQKGAFEKWWSTERLKGPPESKSPSTSKQDILPSTSASKTVTEIPVLDEQKVIEEGTSLLAVLSSGIQQPPTTQKTSDPSETSSVISPEVNTRWWHIQGLKRTSEGKISKTSRHQHSGPTPLPKKVGALPLPKEQNVFEETPLLSSAISESGPASVKEKLASTEERTETSKAVAPVISPESNTNSRLMQDLEGPSKGKMMSTATYQKFGPTPQTVAEISVPEIQRAIEEFEKHISFLEEPTSVADTQGGGETVETDAAIMSPIFDHKWWSLRRFKKTSASKSSSTSKHQESAPMFKTVMEHATLKEQTTFKEEQIVISAKPASPNENTIPTPGRINFEDRLSSAEREAFDYDIVALEQFNKATKESTDPSKKDKNLIKPSSSLLELHYVEISVRTAQKKAASSSKKDQTAAIPSFQSFTSELSELLNNSTILSAITKTHHVDERVQVPADSTTVAMSAEKAVETDDSTPAEKSISTGQVLIESADEALESISFMSPLAPDRQSWKDWAVSIFTSDHQRNNSSKGKRDTAKDQRNKSSHVEEDTRALRHESLTSSKEHGANKSSPQEGSLSKFFNFPANPRSTRDRTADAILDASGSLYSIIDQLMAEGNQHFTNTTRLQAAFAGLSRAESVMNHSRIVKTMARDTASRGLLNSYAGVVHKFDRIVHIIASASILVTRSIDITEADVDHWTALESGFSKYSRELRNRPFVVDRKDHFIMVSEGFHWDILVDTRRKLDIATRSLKRLKASSSI
ncbi:hypothetical protein VTL71DRAFT_16539 [Oculimacula yallundae]|uniref:Uncharacterized protein n=1 Tax=Oculimacula yallundae TaxID=86028 RepID=A0ABR4CEQ4_9HELO